ncbi:MAG: Maf family protein [Desulfobacteraceae bacterium]
MKINTRTIILASKSPRRKSLLEQTGLRFEIIPAEIDETVPGAPAPEEMVKKLSCMKAHHIAQDYPDAAVIGADTIVTIDKEILGKPCSRRQASDMLNMLSGRCHTVFTGYTVCCLKKGLNITEAAATQVFFKKISSAENVFYTNTDEPYDKAGGYAIQGIGSFLVKKINGSYSNVVGLPVCETMEILIKENIVAIGET